MKGGEEVLVENRGPDCLGQKCQNNCSGRIVGGYYSRSVRKVRDTTVDAAKQDIAPLVGVSENAKQLSRLSNT